MTAYLARYVPENSKTAWGVLAYPFDPARPSTPVAEQLSPWSLDNAKKITFISLPHEAAEAVEGLKGLLRTISL